MISEELKNELEKQQYRIVGSHSAIKPCHWTKSMIKGRGSCYKHKFYGIKSSQCLQMTTSMSCANRCVYCWRDYKAPVSKEWAGPIDEPELIIIQGEKAHHKILMGLKGHKSADLGAFNESLTVKHAALSLTGEPIIYPRINELIEKLHSRKISTFLVTNGQYFEELEKLKPVTQLYLSMDAPNKELSRKIGIPLFMDYWERFNKSLEILASKKQRTCIRLTLIKGLNILEPENYALLIKKADPDFIEVKAYMHVGASRLRLEKENMPSQAEVMDFSNVLLKHLDGYCIVTDHYPSRVVLLAKKSYKNNEWHTWIDFKKFFLLVKSGRDFFSPDYSAKTPNVEIELGKKDNAQDEAEMACQE